MRHLKNERGQALLFLTTLLMLLSLLSMASLNLVKTEKLVYKDSVEEMQAYYVADAAVEKVLALLKENSGVLDRFTKNKTYSKLDLNSLKSDLTSQNARPADIATLEKLLSLYSRPYSDLEIVHADGSSWTPTRRTKEGTIHWLTITKTASEPKGSTLRLEVTGKYGQAKRTLLIHVQVSRPWKDISGVVVQHLPNITNASDINAPMVILEGGDFNPMCCFRQSVLINGDCRLGEDTSLRALVPIKVKGDLILASGAQVEGTLQATGSVLVGEGVIGNPVVQGGVPFNKSLPEFPQVDVTWLQKNCDYYYPGDQSLRVEHLPAGIHYVEGNLTVHGNCQGNVTLVATGTITIPYGAILRCQIAQTDSLLLLGFGGVQLEDQCQVRAVVFTPNGLSLGRSAYFIGVIICGNLESNGAMINQDNSLKEIHPTWPTTKITILSWQERYPVLRIN